MPIITLQGLVRKEKGFLSNFAIQINIYVNCPLGLGHFQTQGYNMKKLQS